MPSSHSRLLLSLLLAASLLLNSAAAPTKRNSPPTPSEPTIASSFPLSTPLSFDRELYERNSLTASSSTPVTVARDPAADIKDKESLFLRADGVADSTQAATDMDSDTGSKRRTVADETLAPPSSKLSRMVLKRLGPEPDNQRGAKGIHIYVIVLGVVGGVAFLGACVWLACSKKRSK